MEWHQASLKTQGDLFKALGVEPREVRGRDGKPKPEFNLGDIVDLPNLDRTTDIEFWHAASLGDFKVEARLRHQEVMNADGELAWASPILYFVDDGDLLAGGYMVAYFYSHPKHVEYFRWRACDHEFKSQNLGRCYNKYTCTKCGRFYTIDSSD